MPNRMPPERLPHICTAVEGAQTGELLAKAERALRENSFIELRLDGLKAPAAALTSLAEFCAPRPEAIFLATCRRVTAGGHFRGSAEAECAILSKAAGAGCQWVDVSLPTAERVSAATLRQLRQRANLLVSEHQPQGPVRLAELADHLAKIPADLFKVVCQARSFADNGRVLRFLAEHSARLPLVAFCQGESGVASRILAPRFGAQFTFASLAPGEATAPGQLDAATLRGLYRLDALNRATRVYGVLGYPLAHSLSPLMLNTAFRRASINAVYVPLPAREAKEVLAAMDALALSGFSITLPHKSALLKSMDGVDPVAKRVGAINTVVRSAGKLYGFNTDVAGIVQPLASVLKLAGARALVLGAGGAARAAVFGLKEEGAEVFVANRTAARGRALAAAAKAKFLPRAELKKANFDVLINATPVGQFPKIEASPLAPEEIRAAVVFDLVYNPLETTLLRQAREKGARVISGLEMFVTQGARQFEIWTGKPAPREEMLREVLRELRAERATFAG